MALATPSARINSTASPACVPRPTYAFASGRSTRIPAFSASWSTARKPRLCGVQTYSGPGLPSPTISLMRRTAVEQTVRAFPRLNKRRHTQAFRAAPQHRYFFFSLSLSFSFSFSLGFSSAASATSSPSSSFLPFLMTSGSAGAAASAATASAGFSSSTRRATTWAMTRCGSVTSVIFAGSTGRSPTRSCLPIISSLTSTRNSPGISPGKHSISTSRVTISKMPPCSLTPCGSPKVCTGTFTFMRTSMAIFSRSTWSSEPLTGSTCQSFRMAVCCWVPNFTLKIVLCPDSERKMPASCLALTATATGALFPPYRTPGICPVVRRRRAAFLPRSSRGEASTMICSIRPSLQQPAGGLDKQFANRGLFVDRADAAREQCGDAEDLDLGNFLRGFVERHRVGDHNFGDLRFADALNARPGQHRVRAGGKDLRGALLEERFGGFHQRAGRINHVVDNERGASADVADQVHHFADVHVHAAPVHYGHRGMTLFCKKPRAFHAAAVRRDHGHMRK